MKAFTVCLFAGLAALACAEPPSGYNYQRPSGGSFSQGGSFSSGGSFGGGSFGGGSFGGGSLTPVSDFGGSTNEGQSIDPQILEQVRQIILRSEASGGHGGITSSYGVPGLRVVDISLEGIRQAIQVAQFQQTHQGAPLPIAPCPDAHRSPKQTSYRAPQLAVIILNYQ
ncbi:Hypothetical predicted protein [Cloeon dipterum]|uniref:Uncharacterized protein n=1 Tax=Cloeon dipterum TaxID=197152 RepID=A0A8S1E8F8_9INSE|nr:Hypothetical predicted protein [Cloeon dipterum]